jgi:hypothetical protein
MDRFVRAHFAPGKQFNIKDLHAELQRRRDDGETILLTGAFNECIGDNPKLMASVSSFFDFVDPHVDRNGDAADIPTYIRGTKRLDYCLINQSILDIVSSCGTNISNDMYHSDHCGPI